MIKLNYELELDSKNCGSEIGLNLRSKVILEELDGIQDGGKLRIQMNWKLEITKLVIQCRGKKRKKKKSWTQNRKKVARKERERERERNRVEYG